MRLVKD
jgi:hypothetical protein